MQQKKLSKLERELEQLYRAPHGVKRERLVALATRIGRVARHSQGKEPRYEHVVLPGTRPLTIPGHPGRELKVGTVRSIADHLLQDVSIWRAFLEDHPNLVDDDDESD